MSTLNIVRTSLFPATDDKWRHVFEIIGDDGKGTGRFVEIITDSAGTFSALYRISIVIPEEMK